VVRRTAIALICVLSAVAAHAAILQGNGVVLEFSETAPLGIISVRHAADGPALFVDGSAVQPTWTLKVRDAEGNDLEIDPVSSELGGTCEVTDGKLTMVWDAVEIPSGTARVTCTFEPDAEQPIIYGNIVVDNASDCQLRAVQFPRLDLIEGPEPAESATLVFPRAYGRSSRNPFDATRGYYVGTQEPAGMRGSTEMQFGTLYDDAGNGLYWAMYDGEGYQKRLVYDNRAPANIIRMKLEYMPENCLTPGQDFSSPYPIVLGAYRGDWWDAARIYRGWAMQQKWCAKGPLVTRDDVPEWVSQTDVWIRGQGRYGVDVHRRFNEALQEFFAMRDGSTAHIGVQWYHWIEPRTFANVLRWPMWEGFPELCEEEGAKGFHWEPYVNAFQWNSLSPDFPENGIAAAIHNEDGNPLETSYQEEGQKPLVMCATGEAFRAALVEACVRLVRDGHQQGIYLDQLGAQCGRPCYAADHGHPVGGGHYATDGLRAMCTEIRDAIREVDPEAAISGEVQHEMFIDVTDHRLNHYNVWPGWVNLWAAVYGDMTCTYGRTIVWSGASGDGDSFYAACGNTFISGMQFARIWPTDNEDNWLSSPRLAEQAEYFRTLVDLRRAARKFVELGWLQRPVKYAETMPQMMISAAMGSKTREFEVPCVLDSAWASHDGELAFVLTNTSAAERSFSWSADLATYEIADADGYSLSQIKPDGSVEEIGAIEGKVLARTETMPAHSTVVYRVAAAQ